jgi:hypothetical protein
LQSQFLSKKPVSSHIFLFNQDYEILKKWRFLLNQHS